MPITPPLTEAFFIICTQKLTISSGIVQCVGSNGKTMAFPMVKLLTLLQAHQITNHQTHRALDDITYLMDLLKKTSPNGNLYLQEVLQNGPMRKYQPAAARTKMG